MIYWGTPRFFSKWFNSYHWHGSRASKIIYLTFDDGPTPEVTEKVLDILDQFNVKATFFCLGRNVDRHRDIYNKIIEAGHKTGNHTYSHLKGWKTSLKQYIQDTNLAAKYIDSDLFRPPYGRIRINQTRYLSKNYKIIMWDVLTHDYNKRIPLEITLKASIKSTKNGSIVVFHDSKKSSDNMLKLLPLYIKHFKEKGYTFNKIE